MRVFIGIKASEQLQKYVLDWQENQAGLPVRFTKPQNLHLTLVPPWQEEGSGEVGAKLSSQTYRCFDIYFYKVKANTRPGAIWVESQKVIPEVLEIRENLQSILNKPIDARPFTAHVTLARFKTRQSVLKLPEEYVEWTEKANNLTLFESVPTPSGSNYRPIISVDLC